MEEELGDRATSYVQEEATDANVGDAHVDSLPVSPSSPLEATKLPAVL